MFGVERIRQLNSLLIEMTISLEMSYVFMSIPLIEFSKHQVHKRNDNEIASMKWNLFVDEAAKHTHSKLEENHAQFWWNKQK